MTTAMAWAAAAADELEPPPVDVFGLLGFTPNPGPQTRFLELPDENLDCLYGGSSGGGKTVSCLVYALRACVRYPGLQAFWFRRSFPELDQSVLRQLARFGFARALGARYHEGQHLLRFANGSALTFSHAKNVQEATAFLSAEINLLLIDERSTIAPQVVEMLYSRVRSGAPGVPCLGVRSATNPGSIGHGAVKADYVVATDHGQREVFPDRYGRRRLFVQARVGDTPQLGEEYRAALAGLPEKLRRAYMDGDWSTFEGQLFSELSWDRHVIAPFTLPPTWRRFVGVDWGYSAPWAVAWFAVCPDQRVYVYREIYQTQVGESDQAKRILAAEAPGEKIEQRIADDALWGTRGEQKSVAQIYIENGCRIVPAGKGPGSRVAGWQRIHSYLAEAPACPLHREQGQETCPRLHVFSTCPQWFNELSELPYNTTGGGDPEDSDPKAADHMGDLTRYVLLNIDGGSAEQWIRWARQKALEAQAARDLEAVAAAPLTAAAAQPTAPEADGPGTAPDAALEGVVLTPAQVLKAARDAAWRAQRDPAWADGPAARVISGAA